MSTLQGTVALITGGSKGTGLGIARAFVKEGIAVTLTGRHEAALNAARAELEALVPDARVLTVVADNKDHAAPQAVVDQTVQQFGRLDILINNAQEFRTGIALDDLTWDDMHASYESGVFATWRFMVAALPHLKETKGTVINMGSGAGTQSLALHGAYGSNKEAIRGLSRIAAREWGEFGITVNVINPYVASAESERYEREHPEIIAQIMKQLPLRRIGDAELNVGGLCLFLARPEGKYMTGSTFDVEGGSSIRP
ncbi:SDR family NAD(P)-dependent oxidoreductase (plasmid) [Deinococcus wulumuqiensis]|uniref:SDR family NAD(P)-dependent oxidoreductase n=1 Tax=Deinococcus wulumuqiensis TaxID=980427 RepID=A0A345IMU0_9DEIO|nr:SDR family oxidoreductase [Deinococcus wulumuqiensis]AXH01013.1 SDR family NAD(P)-dependent oxidoreductase [Deinococcus wulumuqiensis]